MQTGHSEFGHLLRGVIQSIPEHVQQRSYFARFEQIAAQYLLLQCQLESPAEETGRLTENLGDTQGVREYHT